ncbi:MAG TPA: hypothetical protein VHE57_05445 [Mycobacteriales bacterium]|nr:hypothetical protein [Mycobacteriales bacterium]
MTTDPATGASAPAPDPMGALVDIRNQVIRLGQEVAALRAEQPAQGPDANAVTAELREAVRFLAERLDGVARMVAQRGEELADTRGALGAIDAHVRSQAETIGVLTTGMQALPSYGQQVSSLQDNLNSLQQRLGSIEGSIGQRLGGIEQAVARPADATISERLSALEGMIGPLAQRLAQAHSDHAASLQSLHSKLESLAAGTQAALAQPAVVDENALAAFDPKIAALSAELKALRSDVGAVLTARSSSEDGAPTVDLSPLAMQLTQLSGELQSLRENVAAVVAARAAAPEAGESTVDLAPLHQKLSELSDQLSALASAPRSEAPGAGESTVDLAPLHQKLSDLSDQLSAIASAPRSEAPGTGDQDVDAAIAASERRVMAHVDDAVFALAQTLLGRAGASAAVDTPAPAAEPSYPAAPAVGHDEQEDAGDLDEGYDDGSDVAQIDFSQAEIDDEDDTTSWQRPEDNDDDDEVPASHWSRAADDDEPAEDPDRPASVPGVDAPFDRESAWGPPPLPVPQEGPSTVVPERRRRWFSW